MNILVTGCAGFIGFHLTANLLNNKKYKVFGIDNLNNYYDTKLKKNRIKILKKFKNKFSFTKLDICNQKKLLDYFRQNKYDYVIHLAAQAGVRFSIENPDAYFNSNILGFYNIMNASRINNVKHFIFASTSSVYGDTNKFPIKETDNTNSPLTFYAASKKSNEVLAHSYANIYKLQSTGLRFFTVYGTYGRPDMSIFKFTNAIINNKFFNLFNNGNHIRDFTHVNDVVDAIQKLLPIKYNKKIPFEIFNIGCEKPIHLKKILSLLEKYIGIKPKYKKLKLQKGDILKTHSSTNKLNKIIGYYPKIKISDGLEEFIKWFRKYYQYDK